MVVLDTLVVITALPSMQRDLQVGLSTLQWTVNAYGIAFAAGIITAAAVGDRLGRRRVFVWGVALFSIASAACAFAPGASELIAARAAQGLGGAMVLPLSLTILIEAFPVERRGAIVGIYGGLAGLAVASGPLIGGAVTEGLDWHWVFWINVPIGVTACLLSLRLLPESHGAAGRLDLPGVTMVTGAVVSLVWGLVRAGDAGWASAEVVSTLAIGAALVLGFFVVERRSPQPMLPLGLLRIRAFAAGNVASLLMGASFAAGFLIVQYFQFALGYSPLVTGARLFPYFVTPAIISPLAGAIADRIGYRPVIASGLLLQAVGLGWTASIAVVHPSYAGIVVALLVAGIGISMAVATLPTAVVGAVAPEAIGTASGVNNMLQRFGFVFGVAIASTVFSSFGRLGTPVSVTAGFRPALAACAVLSLLGAVAAATVAPARVQVQEAAEASRAEEGAAR
jgi:EmrB/QacA subfamily drug resistance transporter